MPPSIKWLHGFYRLQIGHEWDKVSSNVKTTSVFLPQREVWSRYLILDGNTGKFSSQWCNCTWVSFLLVHSRYSLLYTSYNTVTFEIHRDTYTYFCIDWRNGVRFNWYYYALKNTKLHNSQNWWMFENQMQEKLGKCILEIEFHAQYSSLNLVHSAILCEKVCYILNDIVKAKLKETRGVEEGTI